MALGVKKFDVAIIGAGPAGLAAAANASTQKLSHILIEKSELANTIFDYQLGKYVMAEPSNLPLRSLVSFVEGYREDILDKWNSALAEFKINMERAEVLSIEKIKDHFRVILNSHELLADSIVLAIGVQGSPRKLGVRGEDLPHISYTLANPMAYNNEDILIVGAGDAAIENALALCKHNRVVILNRSGEFPRAKESNVRAILQAIEQGNLICYYNSSVNEVIDDKRAILNTPDGELEISCNRIIARLGAIPPRGFLEKLGIELSSKDPGAFPVVNERYETNVKGIYALGALIGYPLIKQAMNQGHEVIEHILGREVEPADQEIISERLKLLDKPTKVALEYLKHALPLFKTLSVPQFRELVSESRILKLAPQEVIFEINDYTDTFFSIVEGEVAVLLSNGKEVVLAAGNFFGEMSLFSGRRRSATIRAKSNCILLETQRRQILKLVRSSQSVRQAIDELFVLRALETSVFPGATRESLKKLLPMLSYKNYKKGEVIFSEGEIGDRLYIIRKGSVQISKKIASGVDVPQSYIPAGSYFGEMAILGSEPIARSATVKAVVACETLSLDRAALLAFLEKNPVIFSAMKDLVNARRVQNVLSENSESQGAMLGFAFREGITDADNVLIIDSDLCVGCDNCQRACAATHDGDSRLDRRGGKSFASIQIPISCRHCENPLCMMDCPPDALQRKPDGEVVINDSCIGCENCTKNCPYGVIQMVYGKKDSPLEKILALLGFESKEEKPKTKKAAKCDMCRNLDLGPACVRACPTGAAMRTNPKAIMDLIDLSQ